MYLHGFLIIHVNPNRHICVTKPRSLAVENCMAIRLGHHSSPAARADDFIWIRHGLPAPQLTVKVTESLRHGVDREQLVVLALTSLV